MLLPSQVIDALGAQGYKQTVEHRNVEWAPPLLFTEEFELVIMIGVVIEEVLGSDRDS